MKAMVISPSVEAVSPVDSEAVSEEAVLSVVAGVVVVLAVLDEQPAIALSSMTTARAKQNNFFMFFIISYLICDYFYFSAVSCTA